MYLVANVQFAAAAGIAAFAYGNHWGSSMWLGAAVAVLAGMTADQVAAGGGISALVLDTFGRLISPTYKGRVAAHEAGHFLIAYLLGMLPQVWPSTCRRCMQNLVQCQIPQPSSAQLFLKVVTCYLKAYTLSALEAYQRYKAFNIQAGTVFCDSDFQKEVKQPLVSARPPFPIRLHGSSRQQ